MPVPVFKLAVIKRGLRRTRRQAQWFLCRFTRSFMYRMGMTVVAIDVDTVYIDILRRCAPS